MYLKTKKELIIDRLLENKDITLEEAAELSKEEILPITYPQPINNPLGSDDWATREMNRRIQYAENCPCNPKNGGSGICGCTLANPFITT